MLITICDVTVNWQDKILTYRHGISEACGGNYKSVVFPAQWQTLSLNTLDNVLLWLANEYNNSAVYQPASLSYNGTVYTPAGTTGGATVGKEYVLEFNGAISQSSLIVQAINKIVILLGGKSVYIEGGNKIIVVM